MKDWTVQVELDKTKGKSRYIPCSLCANETKHDVLSSALHSVTLSTYDITWWEDLEIVQCRGCERLSFRKSTANSDEFEGDFEDIRIAEKIELFPPRIKGRRSLENTYLLPPTVKRIYEEVALSLGIPQPVLAGIGIRALVETVCKEKAATGANLENKIDDLAANGFLTLEGAEILHGLRFLGNDAAHEGKPHSDKTLSIGFDVVENLLTNVYILPKLVEGELKRRK